MQTGEYKFNGVEFIEINKPLMDGLYASALYCMKDKYILEVLAPKTLMNNHDHDEYDEMNCNIGDTWAKDLKRTTDKTWPLSYSSYYIKVNGNQIGESGVISTAYRYEPQSITTKKNHSNLVNSSNLNQKCSSVDVNILTAEEINAIKISPAEALANIFDDDFKETLSSLMDSLLPFDVDDPNYEDTYMKHQQEQERKELEFFNNFRTSSTIPDYLENQPIVIADLIFKEKNLLLISDTNLDLSFIFKNYVKHYLTRINLQLSFGKYEQPIQLSSEQWSRFTDKIFIEGVIEHKKQDDAISEKTPNGKKAIYIVYETIDNESIRPIFYTKEFLTSYDFANIILDGTDLLNNKGTHGFNKYVTFAGYVDENVVVADLELFQLVVTFQCNKEFKLT